MLISTGCTTTEENLKAAGEAAGRAAAEDALPDLPPECYRDVPHAPLAAGMEARSAIALERGQTTRANASKRRCTAFYGTLKAGREKV
jgi:hypothetical protein